MELFITPFTTPLLVTDHNEYEKYFSLSDVSRTKEVFRKINCRKLANKVVNRNSLLFVNTSKIFSFVTAGERKATKDDEGK